MNFLYITRKNISRKLIAFEGNEAHLLIQLDQA